MKLRWGRLIGGALLAELIPVLGLVAAVAIFGPPNQAAAEADAARLGRWVGPIGGAVSCFFVAWWVARSVPGLRVPHGMTLGVLTAALDIGLIVASGTPFEWLFAASNLGRIVSATVGGAVAGPSDASDSVRQDS